MIFGKYKYYKCPKCCNLLSKPCLVSGNTFGLKQFSDGKKIAPMLPEFPAISKCSKCKTIFWLNKEIENTKFNNSEKAEFLGLLDYLSLLENKIYRSKDDEIFIRKRILWQFNDRIRNDKSLFNTEAKESIWQENNNRLIEILDPNNINDEILTIEIYRYFGDFQKCKEIMLTINNPDLIWLLEAFEKEINTKNRSVFQLY